MLLGFFSFSVLLTKHDKPKYTEKTAFLIKTLKRSVSYYVLWRPNVGPVFRSKRDCSLHSTSFLAYLYNLKSVYNILKITVTG